MLWVNRTSKLVLGGIAGVVGAGILTAFVFFKVAEYRAEQEEAGHWQRAGVDRAFATLAHQKPITAMAFSPDGRILATADEGGAYTWDAKTWGKLSVERCPRNCAIALVFKAIKDGHIPT